MEPDASVEFEDVKVGDVLVFVTADTGFGGGGEVERTGEVERITERTVIVRVGMGYLKYEFNSRTGIGGMVRRGGTARLYRRDWAGRRVRRTSREMLGL